MTRVAGGSVVLVLALIAWVGQLVSWRSPATAVRWGVTEAESAVEPAFWADARGEAEWDALTLWIGVAAGLAMIADHVWWPYLAIVAGAAYLYFAGRGILTRVELTRRGHRIGTPENVRVAYVFCSLWAVMGLGAIVAGIAELES